MGGTWRIGKIARIPIEIQASWLIVYALITWTLAVGYFPFVIRDLPGIAYWLAGLIAALLLFVSVLIHELSHALVAQAHGLRVRAITLHVFGGVSQLAEEPRSPRAEFFIAVVGPLASFALAGLIRALTVAPLAPIASAIAGYLVFVNLAVGIFNLLPGFPLDGGRLLRAGLWAWDETFERATYLASRAGIVVAFGLVALGLFQIFGGNVVGGFWFVLLGLFLRTGADTGYTRVRLGKALERLRVRDVMTTPVVTVSSDATLADVADQFWRYHFTSFPVVTDGSVRGIASLEHLRDVPRDRWPATRVDAVMRGLTGDLAARPDDRLMDAFGKATRNGVGRLAVLDGARLVGYVSLKDIAHVLALSGVTASVDQASTVHARRAA